MVQNIRKTAARVLAVAAHSAGTMAMGSGAAQARGSVVIGAHFGGGGYYARPHYWGGPRISLGFGVGPYWGGYGGYYAPYYYPYPYYRSSVIYRDYDDRPYDRSAGLLASPYVQQALVAPVGESVTWANGGVIGRVTTTRDGWAGEKYCREFVENVTVDDSTRETRGTACQSEGSAWRLVANQP
jgi:hypothetical protein